MPPSTLSLIGLLRHMAEVERGWFADHVGMDDAPIYCTEEMPAADFDDVDICDVASDLAILRASTDCGGLHPHDRGVRAAHGHADVLREAIDGATGD